MTPVRVKLYGLKWVTRRSYLVRQAVVLVLGLAIVAVGLWFPRPKVAPGEVPSSLKQTLLGLLDALPWLAGLLLLLYAVETVVVLRLIARIEAAQRAGATPGGAAPAPPPPAPPAPATSLPGDTPPAPVP